jgi:hypothetical protein
MNKLFTNLTHFAKTPGVITNAADKLLSYLLLKDDAAAACHYSCGYCQRISRYVGQRKCKKCCTKRPCTTYWVYCNPGV